ncbi:oxidoreductase [Aurantiacibacter xanthus]|uniref:Oxidoreductase n=1 Tax=Aurantiacibacter xanthus TaxID=1784712 RepID=A0A3A1P5L0_9SPHN|nr:oxidoreductase [Aurantiacibacter xanthus]RIV82619.1 oxidoreductase [Aurantiacibacter xanthus]
MATKLMEPVRKPKAIPQPEPGLTPEILLERARAMRPKLRAAQADCEAGGCVTPEIAAELIAGGFFRMVQPRIFGGYEFGIDDFYKVIIEIARGCSETGWVTSLVGGHPVVLARYPASTQIEVFGEAGDFRCPGALTPLGTAVPVEGGYRVSNHWVSASGIDIGTHFMGLARVEGEDGGLIQAIVDMKDCTIVDDWSVMGMRGTGSKRVDVEDVFVPSERVLRVSGMERGAEPLVTEVPLHENPMYWGLIGPFLIGETAAVAVGAARGALDLFEEILRSKKSKAPPFRQMCHDPVAQLQYGQALSLISTAEAALVRSGEEYMGYARQWKEEGIPFDDVKRMRLNQIAQRCVQMAWEAIDLLFRAAGTSASAKAGTPMGRFLRNVAVLRTHPVLQSEQGSVAAAMAAFQNG